MTTTTPITRTVAVPTKPLLEQTSAKLADHYADLLALGWRQRNERLNNPTLDFHDLYQSDDQLQAALDSLLLIGPPARAHLRALLDEPLRRGEAFVLAAYALAAEDRELLEAVSAVTVAIPELQAALVGAYCWAPVTPLFERGLATLAVPLRLQIVAQRHFHLKGSVDDTLAWLRTLDPTVPLIESALRFVNRLGSPRMAQSACRYLNHEAESVRLAAAQTLLLSSTAEHLAISRRLLTELVQSDVAAIRDTALGSLSLHDPAGAIHPINELANRPERKRSYLRALGWFGNLQAVPILLDQMEEPAHRRLAGAAFALLTGSDPARDGWLAPRQRPERDDDGDDMPRADPDDHLPWPDPTACADWWRRNQKGFDPKQRYFAGRPLTVLWLNTVLRHGPLPWRRLAAEHRCHLLQTPMFPADLPAALQHALYSTLNAKV